MHKISNLLIVIGLIYFAITVALNLYSSYVATNAGSAPVFSWNWWARWFPLYASGATLLLVELMLRLAGPVR